MLLWPLIILAITQGITEFLPISSSAHLILLPVLTGWQDQGPIIDIALHVGTLLAVLCYFARDILLLLQGGIHFLTRKRSQQSHLFIIIFIAFLPIVPAGALLHWIGPDIVRSPQLIAWTTLIFGLLLGLVDYYAISLRRIEHLRPKDGVLIGLLQILALLPGVSRSGIVMTTGRLLGLERVEAARLAMLLGVPTLCAAGVLGGWDIAQSGDPILTQSALLAVFFSFISALIAITILMKWLKKSSFLPFVVYRIALALYLFWIMDDLLAASA